MASSELQGKLLGVSQDQHKPERRAHLSALRWVALLLVLGGVAWLRAPPGDVRLVATTKDGAAGDEAAALLREPAIAADVLAYLDGDGWLASSPSGMSVRARVPGEIATDLQRAGVIGDPLFGLNLKRSAHLFDDEWIFSTRTTLARDLGSAQMVMYVVLDSVKMAADVRWNGQLIHRTTSQFVRAVVPLPPPAGLAAVADVDELSVAFLPSALELTRGRYMACSGGWDWAPYSRTFEGRDHTLTRGLVKSASIVGVRRGSVAISALVPLVAYAARGSPEAALVDGAHAGFTVRVRVFGWALAATPPRGDGDGDAGVVTGSLTVRGSWGAANTTALRLDAAAHASDGLLAELELRASAREIALWWPLGMGAQPLYSVEASFEPRCEIALWWPLGMGAQPLYSVEASFEPRCGAVRAARTVGFRALALATHGFPPPASAASASGSGSVGLALVVNGRGLTCYGANVIPPDLLEGRWDGRALVALVRSAARAHMGCLRVWGGGAYLPPPFYAEADRLGVLVLHDLMFTTTTATHEPRGSDDEAAEVRGAVRALAHHPSIAVWNACNECDPVASPLYASHVMAKVANEDSSRPLWPASPSRGWSAGVDPITSAPDGRELRARALHDATSSAQPSAAEPARDIERHGPYSHGNGWAAVNQFPVAADGANSPLLSPATVRIPLELPRPAPVGFAEAGVFVSEFGVSAMSSFESMAPTLPAHHWGAHGDGRSADCSAPDVTTPFWYECVARSSAEAENPMAERNYPCDPLLVGYFNLTAAELDASGERAFRRQLYLCLLAHALALKAEIEAQRASNTLGLLLWQLNEVWPTGGWGTLEYSRSPRAPSTRGQLLGGRWKPAHHWLREHLFAQVMAVCGAAGRCYVRSDAHEPVNVTVAACARALGASAAALPARCGKFAFALPAGPVVEWFALPHSLLAGLAPDRHFLHLVTARSGVSSGALAEELSSHSTLLAPPHQLARLPPARIETRVGRVPIACTRQAYGPGHAPLPKWCVPVTVRSSATALFVTLTAAVDGHFSRNCFALVGGDELVIHFATDAEALDEQTLAELQSSLRVEDFSAHQ